MVKEGLVGRTIFFQDSIKSSHLYVGRYIFQPGWHSWVQLASTSNVSLPDFFLAMPSTQVGVSPQSHRSHLVLVIFQLPWVSFHSPEQKQKLSFLCGVSSIFSRFGLCYPLSSILTFHGTIFPYESNDVSDFLAFSGHFLSAWNVFLYLILSLLTLADSSDQLIDSFWWFLHLFKLDQIWFLFCK